MIFQMAGTSAYQKYWKKLNIPLIHAPLNIHKLEHEPRFNHALDAYGLFLVIHAILECFKLLSDHPELIDLGDFPLKMAYVHKNQEALLVLGQEPVCFMLLTKAAAKGDLLEKVQEQTGLAFHVRF